MRKQLATSCRLIQTHLNTKMRTRSAVRNFKSNCSSQTAPTTFSRLIYLRLYSQPGLKCIHRSRPRAGFFYDLGWCAAVPGAAAPPAASWPPRRLRPPDALHRSGCRWSSLMHLHGPLIWDPFCSECSSIRALAKGCRSDWEIHT